jgi:hypothetical protein
MNVEEAGLPAQRRRPTTASGRTRDLPHVDVEAHDGWAAAVRRAPKRSGYHVTAGTTSRKLGAEGGRSMQRSIGPTARRRSARRRSGVWTVVRALSKTTDRSNLNRS